MWAAVWDQRSRCDVFHRWHSQRTPEQLCFTRTKSDLLPLKIIRVHGHFLGILWSSSNTGSLMEQRKRGISDGAGRKHVSGRAKGKMVSLMECSQEGDPGWEVCPSTIVQEGKV